jgi:integrator complex subunit 7
MAIIISDRKSVHHCIHDSLDSHDAVELEAAIYAASKFAAQSRTFSVNMCSKIAEMIQGLATPVNFKLKLIPILQYMHHDAHTAAMVRRLCAQLLPSYPAQNFVCVTLHTLTLLASETLVEIPQQLLLLLEYLCDSRRGVQAQVLSDLKILAVKGAHLWTTSNVDGLIDLLLDQPHLELQRRTLDVLVTLAMAEAANCFILKAGNLFFKIKIPFCRFHPVFLFHHFRYKVTLDLESVLLQLRPICRSESSSATCPTSSYI